MRFFCPVLLPERYTAQRAALHLRRSHEGRLSRVSLLPTLYNIAYPPQKSKQKNTAGERRSPLAEPPSASHAGFHLSGSEYRRFPFRSRPRGQLPHKRTESSPPQRGPRNVFPSGNEVSHGAEKRPVSRAQSFVSLYKSPLPGLLSCQFKDGRGGLTPLRRT